MTYDQWHTLSAHLCNLVNNRRIQIGRQPLSQSHIMRAVRYVLGKEPPVKHDDIFRNRKAPVDRNAPVPYELTDKAKALYAQSSQD